MTSIDDIDLLKHSVKTMMADVDRRDEEVRAAFQTSARTGLVNAVRMVRLQRTICAIGIFSLLEALLQRRGWEPPFPKLDAWLRDNDYAVLADTVENYRLAVNILKHGAGRSYDKLCENAASLDFQVKPKGQHFFFEGDVSEIPQLVDVDSRFVERCVEVTEDVFVLIRAADDPVV